MAATTPARSRALPHPLAQLSREEFLKARDIILQKHDAREELFFRSIQLREPAKAELVPYLEAEHAGSLTDETPRPPRLASVDYDLIQPHQQDYSSTVVDLRTGDIVSSFTMKADCQPAFTFHELKVCEQIIFDSDLFKEAMSEFSLPEGFNVTVDPWPYGGPDDDDELPRTMQALVFARDASKNNSDTNHYAYPIPLIPIIDCRTKEVIRVDRLATGGIGDSLFPNPREESPKKLFERSSAAEYVPELLDEPLRDDLKPLNILQPEGPSFHVQADGLVEWQKWRFRLGFTPREGAVLHDVCYEDRPIAYRISFSELTVPYGDPRPPYHRKQAFDFGDGGVGRAANNLQLGCDCLGAIHYFDAYLTAPDGAPSDAKSVVCLHEQDDGILWKHTNFRTKRAVVTRSRELVVQFMCTLANYEYIFLYKLDLAGGITLETRATGIVSVVSIDEGKKSEYGNIVSPGVLAQNHQHIFAARIDPAIDSYREGDTRVVVEETHGVGTDEQINPKGNLYQINRKVVEKASWLDAEPRLNRILRLENVNKKNTVSGKNVGYKLLAPATQMLLADDGSIQAKRAPFAKHNFWVTGYRDGELWAAGDYTNQTRDEKRGVQEMIARGDWFTDDGQTTANGHDGTSEASKGRKSGPVVWPVYGLTHNARTEDWPVMPFEAYQIHLRPADFFVRNPALDVPSTRNQASVLVPCHGESRENECANAGKAGVVQQDPASHLQGLSMGVDAKEVGAATKDRSESRLSRAFRGLFKT